MTARRTVALLGVVVGALIVYLLVRAVDLLRTGSLTGVLLAVAVLLLAVVGAVLVIGEIRFGRDAERLGGLLAVSHGLPTDELPRRPSGRVDRVAADVVFAARRAEVEAAPDDWRGWYRLGIAYGDAGDTGRGRRAVRRAVALERKAAGDRQR